MSCRPCRAYRVVSVILLAEMLIDTPAAFGCQGCDMASSAGQMGNAAQQAMQAAMQMMAQAMQNMTQGQSNMSQGQANQNPGQVDQGMMQMAMAAMQMLSSLLGALASQAAQGKQNQGNGNSNNMNGMGASLPYQSTLTQATSPTPDNNGTTQGNGPESGTLGDTTASKLDLSPPGLHAGQLGAAFDTLEKNYGVNRDDVMKALKNGVDPKDILAGAPKNAPSAELLGKIADKIGGGGGAPALAQDNRTPASVASGAAGTPSDTPAPAAVGVKNPPAVNADELVPDANLALSPEVRAALAAKAGKAVAAAPSIEEMAGWSLFELVHNRYQKVTPMMYGRVESTNINPVPTSLR